jgi:hypothetical protein
LGISDQAQSIIQEKLLTDKRLTDFSIRIKSPSGSLQEGWLCGLPIVESPYEHEPSGAILLLRTCLEAEVDEELSQYQMSLLPYVLERSGSSEYHSMRQFYWITTWHISNPCDLTLKEGRSSNVASPPG